MELKQNTTIISEYKEHLSRQGFELKNQIGSGLSGHTYKGYQGSLNRNFGDSILKPEFAINEYADPGIAHMIGVIGGSVKTRIANAKLDPTYLMADVEIVATYELYNISRTKLENILHRFFESARMDIQINDRLGNPVIPREWFLLPLFIVDEVVEKIKNGSISKYKYDTNKVSLVEL